MGSTIRHATPVVVRVNAAKDKRFYNELQRMMSAHGSLSPGGGTILSSEVYTLVQIPEVPAREAVRLWESFDGMFRAHLEGQRCSSTESRHPEKAAFFHATPTARGTMLELPPDEQAHLFAHLLLPYAGLLATNRKYLEDRRLQWGGRQRVPAIIFNSDFVDELFEDLVNYCWSWLGAALSSGRYPSPEDVRIALRLRWSVLPAGESRSFDWQFNRKSI